ncbi:hypothetical protein [Microbacterium sp. YJN-G]|uniref:hypothetical protein n=1 Tax=Microbacterium sp. YJN-G TaxID=2763257 RepID=UPI001877652C|nr:hypothetical protein [Microbacterium sp. YJN-G]
MAEKKIRGSIRCTLTGGPLDGACYRDLPNPGDQPASARLSIPLSQPAEASVRALHVCEHPGAPDDVWQFSYVRTVFPELPVGTQASFA